MATERTSLLTQGLAPLAEHSAKLRDLLERLYALDDELQAAHECARRDDEFGEQVVTHYKRFLALRQITIDELERQRIAVPWQMRMRIDELELTLRQRDEKQNGESEAVARAASNGTDSNAAKQAATLQTDAVPPASARERRIVTLLVPSLVVLVLALLWYQWFSSAAGSVVGT